MDRNIATKRDVDRGVATQEDTPKDRVLKFVPIETISGYTFLDNGIKTYQEGGKTAPAEVIWLVVLFFFVVTPLYLVRFWKVTRASQVVVSMGAYVVYVLTVGTLFATQVVKIDALLQLLLLGFTGALLVFFTPPEPR